MITHVFVGVSEEKSSGESDDEKDNQTSDKRPDVAPLSDPNPSSEKSGVPTGSCDGYPTSRGSRCFEVLGFDVMIDSKLKPWIIEVNHLPR